MEKPNLNYINELAGNDEIFKKKMISIIKTELPQEIERYQSFFILEDFNQAAEMVHKLKHKISVLGLEKSYYIAEQYENNLKQSSADLKDEFEKIINSMQNFVDNL